MAQTAVCNRHHSLDQQLCRWLLLSLDRLPANELVMTQELIANMLGVRREGVTEAAGKLQEAGADPLRARPHHGARPAGARAARLRVLRGGEAGVRSHRAHGRQSRGLHRLSASTYRPEPGPSAIVFSVQLDIRDRERLRCCRSPCYRGGWSLFAFTALPAAADDSWHARRSAAFGHAAVGRARRAAAAAVACRSRGGDRRSEPSLPRSLSGAARGHAASDASSTGIEATTFTRAAA